jgi:very-short-patch-repair endonuclease
LYCGNEFNTLPNKLETGKSKYCSRECKDIHQKELYLKDGNPVYGNKHTNEWKSEASTRVKDLWETDEFRSKVSSGQERYFEKNGFWCGADDESLKKRELTFLGRYGVNNISEIKEIRTKADETCLRKYGKTSFELLLLGCKNNKGTSIEVKISKILIESDIKFETQYEINFNKTFRLYDFYLPELNLLIEADGDYWHGNPNKFKTLNEVQLLNKNNDVFKNELAKENGYNLIRFWETDIKKKNFKFKLFNELKKYGKKED